MENTHNARIIYCVYRKRSGFFKTVMYKSSVIENLGRSLKLCLKTTVFAIALFVNVKFIKVKERKEEEFSSI